MLFNDLEREAIARGELTQAYRHWKRPQAKRGARHRLGAAGMIEIVEVAEAQPGGITAADAKSAGFAGLPQLLADIDKYARRYPGNTLYCVRFHFVEGPDPRAVLGRDQKLADADVAAITAKLDRMDTRSPHGPWTRETLRLIAANPGRRAGDLADILGRERLDFKRDVRKLKELGLTISLDVGYEPSPRGIAFLATASST